MRELAGRPEKVGQGAPPGTFQDEIEAVFPCAARGRLDLHASLFSIESVNDSEDEGNKCSGKKVSARE